MGNKNWSPPYRVPEPGCVPIGYAHLVAKYRLEVIGHSVWTFLKSGATARELVEDGGVTRIWPSARHPGARDVDHLLLGVRHEGPSLPICRVSYAPSSICWSASIVPSAPCRRPSTCRIG